MPNWREQIRNLVRTFAWLIVLSVGVSLVMWLVIVPFDGTRGMVKRPEQVAGVMALLCCVYIVCVTERDDMYADSESSYYSGLAGTWMTLLVLGVGFYVVALTVAQFLRF